LQGIVLGNPTVTSKEKINANSKVKVKGNIMLILQMMIMSIRKKI